MKMITKSSTTLKYNFHTHQVVLKNYEFLKGFTNGETDQSHTNKMKCFPEETFQRIPYFPSYLQ